MLRTWLHGSARQGWLVESSAVSHQKGQPIFTEWDDQVEKRSKRVSWVTGPESAKALSLQIRKRVRSLVPPNRGVRNGQLSLMTTRGVFGGLCWR